MKSALGNYLVGGINILIYKIKHVVELLGPQTYDFIQIPFYFFQTFSDRFLLTYFSLYLWKQLSQLIVFLENIKLFCNVFEARKRFLDKEIEPHLIWSLNLYSW